MSVKLNEMNKTEIDERGEANSKIPDSMIQKFIECTNASKDPFSEIFARDQLLMMYELPESIKIRLKALKRQQVEIKKNESDFHLDLHDLEMKFQRQYNEIYNKRMKIITGKIELNKKDFFLEKFDILPEITSETESKLKLIKSKLPNEPGIPDFWLTIFKNVNFLNEIIYPRDEGIIKHLVDIRTIYKRGKMTFRLEFIFSPNNYFTNSKLTKEYGMICMVNEADPFSFEGPEIVNSKGCIIDWNPGRDVTKKLVRVKQRKGSLVTSISKTIKNNSFFNFFSPPPMPNPEIEIDKELKQILMNDFELGQFFRDKIIPNAVLHYTGELEALLIQTDDEVDEDYKTLSSSEADSSEKNDYVG